MDFRSVSSLSELLSRYENRGKSSDAFERLAENQEARRERRAERRAGKKSEESESTDDPVVTAPGTPDAETPDTEEAAPVEEEETSPPEASSLDQLARLYVAQFEEGAGRTLSEEEFDAKVKDVSDFYSRQSNGESRLDEIVFANDKEGSVVA